jgi:hypothetical protein
MHNRRPPHKKHKRNQNKMDPIKIALIPLGHHTLKYLKCALTQGPARNATLPAILVFFPLRNIPSKTKIYAENEF